MDAGRVLVAFMVILAPPLAYGAFLAVYNARRRRARLRSPRLTVAEVIERATRADIADSAVSGAAGQPIEPRLDPEPPDAAKLPRGWHWPTGNPDHR
ncbi:hypothetical protein ACWEOG_23155 [Amycolatopsis japonica]